MNNRDRLILLADSLDRRGLFAEASTIDRMIVKKSFDEETRGDINSVLQMTLQLLDELDNAVERGVAGLETEPGSGEFVKGYVGAIEDEPLKNYYKDKIMRLREAAEHVQEFTDLTSENEEESQDSDKEDADNLGEERDSGGASESEENWWDRFRSKGDSVDKVELEDAGEETTLHNPGNSKSPRLEEDDLLEEEFDSDKGSVRRTSGGGVTVEQSMSNIGNVNIGE